MEVYKLEDESKAHDPKDYEAIIEELTRELERERMIRDTKVLAVKRSPQYLLGNAFLLALIPSKHTFLFPYRCAKIIGRLVCEKINKTAKKLAKKHKYKKNKIYKFLLERLIPKEERIDVNHIEDIPQLEKLYKQSKKKNKLIVGRKLFRRYKNTGRITDSVNLLNELIANYGYNEGLQRELTISIDKLDLLHSDRFMATEDSSRFKVLPKGKKVLNVLNTSIPYLQNGYSIRSKYIIENQRKMGLEPVVVTRPGFPNDFFEDSFKEKGSVTKEQVDGVNYYRTHPDAIMRFLPFSEYLDKYVDAVCRVIDKEKPDFVQSASNYVNGMAGLLAARKKGIPFVYEIRGFWELTTITKEPLYKNSENFRLEQKLEKYLVFNADRLVVISQGLKKELIKNGIEEHKITVVPNGVDTTSIQPLERNESLFEQYQLQDKFVLGYIGSILRYEGLQELITVISDLVLAGNNNIRLLIAGDGDYLSNLKLLAKELDLEEYVIFLGKIPHSEVPQYYSLFDLCVFPRLDEEVTNIVTPLKPLEAMASGKVVLGSNLEAMCEMIVHEVSGFVFDNSREDMSKHIIKLYKDKKLCEDMKQKARNWVVENRDWQVVTKGYLDIYVNKERG